MGDMNTLEFVRARLEECGSDGIRAVSEATGVAIYTLWRIREKRTSDPRNSTLEPLRAYFAAKDSQ